jgi:hypothetical protein
MLAKCLVNRVIAGFGGRRGTASRIDFVLYKAWYGAGTM